MKKDWIDMENRGFKSVMKGGKGRYGALKTAALDPSGSGDPAAS